MKLTKRKGDTRSIRKIWSDDGTEFMGLVGTIEDLTAFGAIDGISQYSLDTWCCLPAPDRIERWAGYGATRERAIKNAVFGIRIGG